MISPKIAKCIDVLPNGLVGTASKALVHVLIKKYAKIHMIDEENFEGIKEPTLIVCNHLSNSDGLVLHKALKKLSPTFVAGEKLSNNIVTNIGVNVVKTTTIKPNKPDKEGLKKIIKLVKSGENILIFPEGTRSRTGSLIEAKRGILLIQRMTNAPILPICLYGSENLLPIDMDGDMSAERLQEADVYIRIGKQYRLPVKEEGQSKKDYEDFAIGKIMTSIAELLPEDYRGVYK